MKNRTFPFPAWALPTAVMALILAFVAGPVRGLQQDRTNNSAFVEDQVSVWEERVRELDRESNRERTFKAAYGVLDNLVCMTECLSIWKGQARVAAPADLHRRLENAYLTAGARADTWIQRRRMRDMAKRYDEALALLQHLPQATPVEPAVALDSRRPDRS